MVVAAVNQKGWTRRDNETFPFEESICHAARRLASEQGREGDAPGLINIYELFSPRGRHACTNISRWLAGKRGDEGATVVDLNSKVVSRGKRKRGSKRRTRSKKRQFLRLGNGDVALGATRRGTW